MAYHIIYQEKAPRECTAHHQMSHIKDSRIFPAALVWNQELNKAHFKYLSHVHVHIMILFKSP